MHRAEVKGMPERANEHIPLAPRVDAHVEDTIVRSATAAGNAI
jgi:hypothetical protein